jgi:meiotic recombination protein SPO11
MVGCTRSSLNVMASEKGVVVGKLQFRDDGDLIDCSLMGVSGKNIPSFMDRVSDIRSVKSISLSFAIRHRTVYRELSS